MPFETETRQRPESAVLVGVRTGQQSRDDVAASIAELRQLTETAEVTVLAEFLQDRNGVDAKTFVGKGKISEIKEYVNRFCVDAVIFDDELSAAQMKNLQHLLGVKILDRSNVILDIFASHARTREAKTQVELAQLNYTLPKLTRMWTHLSRQSGGGVGLRGPGETQLETDKRLIQKRITTLKAELKQIEMQRQTRRKRRQQALKLALIGYTNVGKSTLFNVLTDAAIKAENKLFATLDSTVRKFETDHDDAVTISDTVGFIRKLPHHLVASFKSTLDEVLDADVLVHVVDISSAHWQHHIATVNSVLRDLGVHETPQLMIFNKVDLLTHPGVLREASARYPEAIFISARQKVKINAIRERINEMLTDRYREIELDLHAGDGQLINQLHRIATVLDIRYEEDRAYVRCRISHAELERFEKMRISQSVEVL